jgi:hypothetical protein
MFLHYMHGLWNCYVFSVFLFNVILLAALRYVLGRCNNIYCAGFTYQKCGRELWCPVVSPVWSVFPWPCLSVNCCAGSAQWMLSVMFISSCRCLGLVVAVGWDRPFVVHTYTYMLLHLPKTYLNSANRITLNKNALKT